MGDVVPLRPVKRWRVQLRQISGKPIGVELLPFDIDAADEQGAIAATMQETARRLGGTVNEHGFLIVPSVPGPFVLDAIVKELP